MIDSARFCNLCGRLGATHAKKFISELEAAVPSFYERVGQHLKGWQPRAPRLREDRAEAESVSVEALAEALEENDDSGAGWLVPVEE
ncbi:MAG: hypothetical protein ACFE0R_10120 [Salinarimonas sp.]